MITPVVPKCAVPPLGAMGLPKRALRGKGRQEGAGGGPLRRVVRLFTTEVTFRPDIGKLVSHLQVHSSH
jgi:hypothetical protein